MASTSAQASASAADAGAAAPTIRSHYRRQRSFAPLYTGGAATALSSDGQYLFAPVNDTIHVTHVPSGRTAARIPSDLEEVSCLALSPDQGTLVLASRSLALRVVALEYGQGQRRAGGPANDTDADGRSKKSSGSKASGGQTSAEEEVNIRVSWTIARNIARTHDAPVVVMRIDPTSTLVATGAADGCAKVWDMRGGFCTHVFRGHGGVVSSLAWNMPAASSAANAATKAASGTSRGQQPQVAASRVVQLFSGSIDGRVRVWDLRAAAADQRGAKPLAALESHFSVVRGLALSTDGQRLVTAGRDRMLAFWERQDTNTASRGKHTSARKSANDGWHLIDTVTAGESLESAGFVDDDETFWTGGAEGEARLWSFSRRTMTMLQPGGRFARGLVGKGSAIKGGNGALGEEDADNEDEDETRAITEVHWLAPINTLVTVHADQNIVMRVIPTLVRTRQLAGFNDQIIDAALLSPIPVGRADTHLAVATNSTEIRVYTLGAEQHNVDVLPDESTSDEGHSGLILCLDKSPDGKWLASGGKDRTVRVWALVPRAKSSEHKAHLNGVDDEEMGEVVKNVSAQVNTTDGSQPQELVWRCVAVAEGHAESVGAIAFARRPSSPGAVGAPFMVTGSQDRTAKVWDLSSLASHIERSASAEGSGAFAPLKLSSLTTLKIHDKDINALDISPNNALLLTGSQDKTAKVFGIQYIAPSRSNNHTAGATLKLLTTCRGHKRGVWSVAFSPADAVFLTGSSDRTLKLWSINDGFACVKNYVGHTNSVLKVRFLKGCNGIQCLSGASDGLVKVWNVRTEECVDTLDGHEERVWGLDCTRAGDILISGGADGMIRFWQDWTQRADEAQTRQRQRDVEQEQLFGNLVATSDYRNAISLALGRHQPRRLLQLLTTVGSQRSHGDAASATGHLLGSAIGQNGRGNEGLLSAKSGTPSSSTRDPELAEVLARAGVLTRSEAHQVAIVRDSERDADPAGVSNDDDASSITGSADVDRVIASLRPRELATLITFVRDWNTSVRTSGVAQTTLHAILRFHGADNIVGAFDEAAGRGQRPGTTAGEVAVALDGRDQKEDRYSDGEEEGVDGAAGDESAPIRGVPGVSARGRQGAKPAADLGNVLDAMLPYTQRHYDRAQRILAESAMLEYTLACMDTVLGVDDGNEGKGSKGRHMGSNGALGNGAASSDNDDVMASADGDDGSEASSEDDGDDDAAMQG